MSLHVVVGYGPAGAATAQALVALGHEVRVVSRSVPPPAPGVEFIRLDATDADRLAEAAQGASVLYNCAAPTYTRWPRDWPALAAGVNSAAETNGAVLVSLSNLYAYGPVQQPMTEELPLAATGPKGRARALVWENAVELHRQGRIRVVEARASDFFGPGVTDGGHLGGRLMPALLHGRTVRVLGDPAVPHSWTYLPDVARTLIELGSSESAWGRPWHVPTAPPESLRAMVTKLSEAAGTPQIKVRQVPPGLVRVIGAFSPFIRELGEIRYQFQQPFVIDSSACTEQFGLTATALSTQIHANVEWWQQREAQAH